MRQYYLTVAAVAVLAIGGVAQAAPAFGARAHNLGGAASQSRTLENKPLGWIELALGIFGVDLAASVEPVAGDKLDDSGTRAKECEESKKAEVAKAEPQNDQGSGSKGRAMPNEPVYLAF